ncbi:MAG: ABC transporter permease [Chloracidobacterium sp.]|nr:ABC transporter permease [Chloracidobacterium sp.]
MSDYFRAFVARLRGLFGDRRVDQELDDEIEAHLRLLTERYVRQGMTETEAARAARRQFGNVILLKENHREMRGIRFIETIVQDLKYGLRMLRRNPGFTLVAVLTLTLGIGANTAIFSVVNVLLLKPLPYYDPQRLVWITEALPGGSETMGAADYIHWREESKTFDHLVAFWSRKTYLTGRGEPEQIDSVMVTANFFPALGVAPQLGRAFTPEEEDQPNGGLVVVLSHSLWQRRFGGDPGILGQSLTFDGKDRVVIGVMPPDFQFIHKVDVLLPRALNVQKELMNEGMGFLGDLIGRIKPGFSDMQAQSELNLILQRLRQQEPKRLYGERAILTPLGERLFGSLRLGLLVLFVAAGFILLIACANVANLMLARAKVRQKEMAIRAAMGASCGRLVRQMLTESLLLSIFGGAAGLLLALQGVKVLAPLTSENLTHLKESSIDGAALGFTLLASLLTGVVVGIIPALQVSRNDLNESLKEGARSAAFSKLKSAQRVSPALVVGELALTLALLTGAGLLIKSYIRVQAVAPGFSPENLLTMKIPLYTVKYPLAQRKIIYQDLLTRINSLPGVMAAALGPITLTSIKTEADNSPGSDLQKEPVKLEIVSSDYFRAMGMQLRAGRGFTNWTMRTRRQSLSLTKPWLGAITQEKTPSANASCIMINVRGPSSACWLM